MKRESRPKTTTNDTAREQSARELGEAAARLSLDALRVARLAAAVAEKAA